MGDEIKNTERSNLSCLLCFQLINIVNCKSTLKIYSVKDKQDILQCSKRLLPQKITQASFQDNWKEKLNLFCFNCTMSSENLWLIDENLGKSKEELNNFIRIFTKQIFKSRVTVLSKKARMPTKAHQSTEKSVQFSCLFCFSSIDNRSSFANEIPYDYIHYKQIIFQSCCRLLSESIKGDSFDWTYSSKSRSPFCLNCFQSSEKLWTYEEKMTKITEELEECICSFSRTVLQSRLNTLYKKCGIDISEALEPPISSSHKGIKKSEYSSCSSLAASNCSSNTNSTCKPQIIIETFKREPLENEDSGDDGHFDIVEYISEPVSDDLQLSNNATHSGTSFTNEQFKMAGCRELRVCLERLPVTSNGEFNIKQRTTVQLRKRKAAVAAATSISISNWTLQNDIAFDDKASSDANYELSDNRADDFESDFDNNEIKPEKSAKRKRNTKKRILKSGVKGKKSWREKFRCVVCSSIFSNAALLDKHSEETSHVNERLLQCTMCPKKFYRKCDLRTHLGIHDSGIRRTCKICGKVSSTANLHKYHVKTHKPKKKYEPDQEVFKCEICFRSFIGRWSIREHMLVHKKINFKCQMCPATFSYRRALRKHKVHHKSPEDKFQCQVCYHFYKDERALNKHMKCHKEENKQKCDSCEMTFEHSRELVIHKVVAHGKEYPHKCDQCQSGFPATIELNFHLKMVHKIQTVGRKSTTVPLPRYDCEKCGKFFRLTKTLEEHIRRKHDENRKPKTIAGEGQIRKRKSGVFPCEECGKVYSIKCTRDTHVKVVHKKQMSFTCHICGKLLASSKGLTAHLLIHSGKTHDCPFCGRGFPARYNLTLHIRRVHEQNKKVRKSYTRTLGAEPKHPTIMANPSADMKTDKTENHLPNEVPPKINLGINQQHCDNNASIGSYTPIGFAQLPELSLPDGPRNYFEKLIRE